MVENKIYEKGSFGWLIEQAKKDGFENIRDWQNWKRYQNIKNIEQVESILEENNVDIKDTEVFYRFWDKVNIKDNKEECWNWTAGINYYGYGHFGLSHSVVIRSNRMAYMLTKGAISKDLNVLHTCNNTKCCNPNHLILGNQSENARYAVKCGRWNNYGENNGFSKLTTDQVREIHILYNEERCKYPDIKKWHIQKDIAKRFGMDSSQINRIINGKYWPNIYKEFH